MRVFNRYPLVFIITTVAMLAGAVYFFNHARAAYGGPPKICCKTISAKDSQQNLDKVNYSCKGEVSGTTGQARPLVAFAAMIQPERPDCFLQYSVHHFHTRSWTRKYSQGTVVHIPRTFIDSIAIYVKGCQGYRIEGQGHIEEFGWQPSRFNCTAGDFCYGGMGKRLEAIKLKLVKK